MVVVRTNMMGLSGTTGAVPAAARCGVTGKNHGPWIVFPGATPPRPVAGRAADRLRPGRRHWPRDLDHGPAGTDLAPLLTDAERPTGQILLDVEGPARAEKTDISAYGGTDDPELDFFVDSL